MSNKMSEKRWKKWAKWKGWRATRDASAEGRQKVRCIHCHRPFRTAYGFHLACKACRTEEDYLRSFEWALALSAVK